MRAQAPVHAAGAQAQQDGEGAALQRQQPAQALSPFSALSGLPGFGHMDQVGSPASFQPRSGTCCMRLQCPALPVPGLPTPGAPEASGTFPSRDSPSHL